MPQGGTLVILGLGPIGSMACKVANQRLDCHVIGVDMVPDRIQRARDLCGDVIDMNLDDPIEVFISEAQFEYWKYTHLTIDVVPGRGAGFSVEGPTGMRFLIRSRMLDDAELVHFGLRTGG